MHSSAPFERAPNNAAAAELRTSVSPRPGGEHPARFGSALLDVNLVDHPANAVNTGCGVNHLGDVGSTRGMAGKVYYRVTVDVAADGECLRRDDLCDFAANVGLHRLGVNLRWE